MVLLLLSKTQRAWMSQQGVICLMEGGSQIPGGRCPDSEGLEGPRCLPESCAVRRGGPDLQVCRAVPMLLQRKETKSGDKR